MSTLKCIVTGLVITGVLTAALYLYGRSFAYTKRSSVFPRADASDSSGRQTEYREESVRIDCGRIKLSGTLALPTRAKLRGGVVLIGGSGETDRDSSVEGHQPFAVLAHYLAAEGFGVLRYDKRGAGSSSGDFESATVQDFAEDANFAFHALRSRPELSGYPCGVIGHSEGAIVAGMLLTHSESSNINFLVMMAPPGLKGKEFGVTQSLSIGRSLAVNEHLLGLITNYIADVYDLAATDEDVHVTRQRIMSRFEQVSAEIRKTDTNGLADAFGTPADQAKVYTSPWLKSFAEINPSAVLTNIHCPALILQGDKDVQVPVGDNFKNIQSIISSAKMTNFTLKILPSHNHLFQKATTGSVTEYATIDHAISADTLTTLAGWLRPAQ